MQNYIFYKNYVKFILLFIINYSLIYHYKKTFLEEIFIEEIKLKVILKSYLLKFY